MTLKQLTIAGYLVQTGSALLSTTAIYIAFGWAGIGILAGLCIAAFIVGMALGRLYAQSYVA